MGPGVFLSIDTELTWRAHRDGASWRENFARSIEPAGVGLRYQLDRLKQHGLKACFFVDPMPALLFGIEPIRNMVAPILAAGQEVQLHIHPIWAGADRRPSGSSDRRFELIDYTLEEQVRLIEQGRDLLREAGAPDPIAFRAGSFGANADTLAAVARIGFAIDSSHDGGLVPWPCQTGLPPRAVSPFSHNGLIELPMGVIVESRGRMRHLQIGSVSLAEMCVALAHAEREGNPLVTILGHSFELATRDGRLRNGVVCRRFDRLCAWLAAHRERFPTHHATDLATVPLGKAATPARPGLVRRIARIAEQGFANLCYERRP